MPPDHVYIGYTGPADEPEKVTYHGLSHADRREHLYVLGRRDERVRLLGTMAYQDITRGERVVFFDVDGSASPYLLHAIPPERAIDTVYWDVSREHPVGLNLVETVPEHERPFVVESVLRVFKSVWGDGIRDRSEHFLRFALRTLMDAPDTSLLGVPRLLIDAEYRTKCLRHVRDPLVRAFWREEFERKDPRWREEAIAPVQNKLGQLFGNPYLRNIVAQVRSSLDLPFLLNAARPKIIIINLARSRVGERVMVLGSILLEQCRLGALRRAGLEDAGDCFVYVNDVHLFAHDTVAALLAETSYRVNLTVANHSITLRHQPELRDTLLGLCGNLVAFACGHEDAGALVNQFGSLKVGVDDVVGLASGELYLKPIDQEPLWSHALPLLHEDTGAEAAVRRYCADRYERAKERVEDRIARFMGRR